MKRRIFAVLLAAVLLAPVPALADTIISSLTYSNTLPDGFNYGTVTVSSVDDYTVSFKVDMDETLLVPGTNYGIDKFYFNTLLSPVAPASNWQFSGPAGWGVKFNKNLSEFGTFELAWDGNGGTRAEPLSFTLRYLDQLITPEDFYVSNCDGFHFAVHDAGFSVPFKGAIVESAMFADGRLPVSEPGTLMLLGSGLVGLAVYSRRKIRR